MTAPRHFQNIYPAGNRGVYLPVTEDGSSTAELKANAVGGPFYVPDDHKWLKNGWLVEVAADAKPEAFERREVDFDELPLPVLQKVARAADIAPEGTHAQLSQRLRLHCHKTGDAFVCAIGETVQGVVQTAAAEPSPFDALELSDIKAGGLRKLAEGFGLDATGSADELEAAIQAHIERE